MKSFLAVAITTREYYIQMRAELRTRWRANNSAKHRDWHVATLRRQLVNTSHYSTRRSMSPRRWTENWQGRPPTAARSPTHRQSCEWQPLSRALAPARPSDPMYCVLGERAYYGLTSIIISAKFYLTSRDSTSPPYYARTHRRETMIGERWRSTLWEWPHVDQQPHWLTDWLTHGQCRSQTTDASTHVYATLPTACFDWRLNWDEHFVVATHHAYMNSCRRAN